MVPVRWMPYESYYGYFSAMPDIWSFGVCMWEIYKPVKRKPYEEMTNKEVFANAMKGPKYKPLPRPEA